MTRESLWPWLTLLFSSPGEGKGFLVQFAWIYSLGVCFSSITKC